jgi:hypothetical protein
MVVLQMFRRDSERLRARGEWRSTRVSRWSPQRFYWTRGWSAVYSLWWQQPGFSGIEDGVLHANLFTPSASGRGEDKDYDMEVSCVRGSKKTTARDVASSPLCWRSGEGDEEEGLLLLLEMVPGPRPRRATLGLVVGPTR